jgi:hypothetical protein
VRVIYLAGWGRSGSTVLDAILGTLPGFVSVGELRSLWDVDALGRWQCSCGTPVLECSQWGTVLRDLFDEFGFESTADVRKLRDEETRTRHLPRLAVHIRRSIPESKYRAVLLDLYRTVLKVTGGRVIVDSSKHPADALLLSSSPEVQLTVVHVVRDPRASAYSWSRPDASGGSRELLPTYSPLVSSSWWSAWNVAIEVLLRPRLGDRYIRVRYEDLMAAPRRQLESLVRMLGAEPEALPFVDDTSISLRRHHLVQGNPRRHVSGTIALAPDERWKQSMSRGARWAAVGPALPLLRRYGYPLAVRSSES